MSSEVGVPIISKILFNYSESFDAYRNVLLFIKSAKIIPTDHISTILNIKKNKKYLQQCIQ